MSKKVLILSGSPRRNGNSDILEEMEIQIYYAMNLKRVLKKVEMK